MPLHKKPGSGTTFYYIRNLEQHMHVTSLVQSHPLHRKEGSGGISMLRVWEH